MQKCSGAWFGSHLFQARFDTKFPDRGFKIETFRGSIDDLKDKTYVHDICVKCGSVVKRTAFSDDCKSLRSGAVKQP